ncbi:hypothetical protein LCGC14_2985500, partial [marine sediment metagenome]
EVLRDSGQTPIAVRDGVGLLKASLTDIFLLIGIILPTVGALHYGYQWALIALGLCFLALGLIALLRERRS